MCNAKLFQRCRQPAIAYSEFDYPEGRKAGNVIKRIIVRQIRIKEY